MLFQAAVCVGPLILFLAIDSNTSGVDVHACQVLSVVSNS